MQGWWEKQGRLKLRNTYLVHPSLILPTGNGPCTPLCSLVPSDGSLLLGLAIGHLGRIANVTLVLLWVPWMLQLHPHVGGGPSFDIFLSSKR